MTIIQMARKGGKARRDKLSQRRIDEIASIAGKARWKNHVKKAKPAKPVSVPQK